MPQIPLWTSPWAGHGMVEAVPIQGKASGVVVAAAPSGGPGIQLPFLTNTGAGKLGGGFNALNGSWCLSPIQEDLVRQAVAAAPVGGYRTSYKLSWVRSRDALDEFTSADLFVSARYGAGSGSADLSRIQQRFTEKFAHYVVLSVTLESDPVMLDSPKLSDEARQRLQSGQFLASYGTHFASGVIYGGNFSAVLELQTTNDSQYNALKVALAGKYDPGITGGAEVKANFLSTIRQVQETFNLQFTVVRDGLRTRLPSVNDSGDIQKLIEAATSFPEDMQAADQANGSGQVALRFVMMPNTVLGAPSTAASQRSVQSLLRCKVRAEAVRAEYRYALDNADEWFPPLKGAELQAELDAVDAYIDRLGQRLEECANSQDGCTLEPGDPLLDIPPRPVFHGRAAWQHFLVQEPVQPLGELREGERARVAFDNGTISTSGTHQVVSMDQLIYREDPAARHLRIRMGLLDGSVREEYYSPDLTITGPCKVWLLWDDEPYGDNQDINGGAKVVMYLLPETDLAAA